MQFYKVYEQPQSEEVERLIRERPFCQLVTPGGGPGNSSGRTGCPQVGLFNPIYRDGTFVLHLNRRDEQLAELRANPRALIAFHDFLAIIPSYWVDETDASFATMYYRYAEFDCDADIHETPEAMVSVFQNLLGRHQPEAGYSPLDAKDPLYSETFAMLAIVTLRPRTTRTKWKMGQNRPLEVRQKVVAKLRERNDGGDARAADELEILLRISSSARPAGPAET